MANVRTMRSLSQQLSVHGGLVMTELSGERDLARPSPPPIPPRSHVLCLQCLGAGHLLSSSLHILQSAHPSSPHQAQTTQTHFPDPTPQIPTDPPPTQAVNWLRRQCVEGLSALLADEPGLGTTASVVAFVQSLRRDFRSLGPVLVVVPPASLAFWKGEFAFWADAGCNVVSFAGSSVTRGIIHDHELWLTPGSMDGRSTFDVHRDLPAKVRKRSHRRL